MSDWETVCVFILNSLHALYIIRSFTASQIIAWEKKQGTCDENYLVKLKELAEAHTVGVCLVTDKNWQL